MRDPFRTPLCELLGVRLPIVLAPMAGGPNGPELVAAVSRAGGLGMFGVMGMSSAAVREDVARALELSDGAPVGVNVQIAPRAAGRGRPEDVAAALAPVRAELGLPEDVPPPPGPAEPVEALVQAGLDAGARVVGAALGSPAILAPAARAAGAPLLAMVSTVEEARRSVADGADVIIAQGAEAGGHRTTFDVEDGVPLVGTLALVPRVVDAVDVPVIAAGGIMDGRGVAAAFALGAQGVSLGTRFLLAAEARVPDVHRQALVHATDDATVISDAPTGRPARWIDNPLLRVLAGQPHLGWGAQRAAVDDVRRAAASAGRADLMPMLAGQGAGLVTEIRPAAEIVAELVDDARAVLARLAGAEE